jgi:hypothetical protein
MARPLLKGECQPVRRQLFSLSLSLVSAVAEATGPGSKFRGDQGRSTRLSLQHSESRYAVSRHPPTCEPVSCAVAFAAIRRPVTNCC